MKNQFQILTVFLLLSLISSISIIAQESTSQSVKLERLYSFDENTKTKQIKIEVTREFNFIHVFAGSEISAGTLKVEIYNPKKEKTASYELGELSDADESLQSVKGKLNKAYADPIKGTWVVKIIPKRSKGQLYLVTRKDLLSEQEMLHELHKK